MPTFDYPNGPLASNTYATAADLDQKFQAIADFLNGNIDDENISGSAQISPAKIGQGGAVTAAELTESAEAGKIPVYGTDGSIYVKKIVFKTGVA